MDSVNDMPSNIWWVIVIIRQWEKISTIFQSKYKTFYFNRLHLKMSLGLNESTHLGMNKKKLFALVLFGKTNFGLSSSYIILCDPIKTLVKAVV